MQIGEKVQTMNTPVTSLISGKSYRDITRRVSGELKTLRGDMPDVMKGFSALAQAAS